MDVSLVIRQRLEEFGLEQRELAQAAQVTESYISQLLTRRKVPPAPSRTDIYDKMDKFLKLPSGELARVADRQRKAGLKRELGDQPAPLFQEVRGLILRKCNTDTERHIRGVFEKDYWLRMVAELSHRSFEETRVIVLEFLDTDIFHLSREHCVSFLDPLIQSWDIDLTTFALDIVLNPRVVSGHVKRFEFIERETGEMFIEEPGLRQFLEDPALSGTATAEEVRFLKRLKFRGKRPTPLYYYRELQNLRDALHFHPPQAELVADHHI
jgi:transcriptional regulator with XRE-family HTH domain